MIFKSVSENIVTSGMILITIVGAVLFARFLTVSGFSHGMTEWIQEANMPRLVVFLFVCCVYLFLGCFVSSIGMMVMTLPSFYPLMMSLGYDPIWFCIIVVIMCEIAFITPPVGINLFAVKSVAGMSLWPP